MNQDNFENFENFETKLTELPTMDNISISLSPWGSSTQQFSEKPVMSSRLDAAKSLRLDTRMQATCMDDSPFNLSQSIRKPQTALPLGHLPSPLFGQGKSIFSPYTRDNQIFEQLKIENEDEAPVDETFFLVPVKQETATSEDGLVTPQYNPTANLSTPPHVLSALKAKKEAVPLADAMQDAGDSEVCLALEEVIRNFYTARDAEYGTVQESDTIDDFDSESTPNHADTSPKSSEDSRENNESAASCTAQSLNCSVSSANSLSPKQRGGRGGRTGRPVGRPRKYPVAETDELTCVQKQGGTRAPATRGGRGGRGGLSRGRGQPLSSTKGEDAPHNIIPADDSSRIQQDNPARDTESHAEDIFDSDSSDFSSSDHSDDDSDSESGCGSDTENEYDEESECKYDGRTSYGSEYANADCDEDYGSSGCSAKKSGKRKLSMYSSKQTGAGAGAGVGRGPRDGRRGGKPGQQTLRLDAEYLKGLIERKEVTAELLNARPDEKAMDSETRRLWRRVRRMIKNRQSAQLSRQRKREQLSYLQGECNRLHSRCEQLRRILVDVRDGALSKGMGSSSSSSSSSSLERLIKGLIPASIDIDTETPRAVPGSNITPSKRRRRSSD